MPDPSVVTELKQIVVAPELKQVLVIADTKQIVVAQTGTKGDKGEKGDAGASLPGLPAAQAISALRMLSQVAGVYAYTNPADAASVYAIAGLSLTSVAAGSFIVPARNQVVTDASWSWLMGASIFVANNGILTQTPPTQGYQVSVAQPLSTATIYVSIEEIIKL